MLGDNGALLQNTRENLLSRTLTSGIRTKQGSRVDAVLLTLYDVTKEPILKALSEITGNEQMNIRALARRSFERSLTSMKDLGQAENEEK